MQHSSTLYWLSIIDLYRSGLYWRQPLCGWLTQSTKTKTHKEQQNTKTLQVIRLLLILKQTVPAQSGLQRTLVLSYYVRVTKHKKTSQAPGNLFSSNQQIHWWPHLLQTKLIFLHIYLNQNGNFQYLHGLQIRKQAQTCDVYKSEASYLQPIHITSLLLHFTPNSPISASRCCFRDLTVCC